MERRFIFRAIGCGFGVLALGGAVLLAVMQEQTISRLRAEQREKGVELERLRSQNKDIQGSRNHEAEADQLRENTRDLMRLRNEVRQLREQQQETELLKTANAQMLELLRTTQLSSNQIAVLSSVRAKGAALGIIPGSSNAGQPSAAGGNGVAVASIDPNSPVAQSDLKVGDVILRVDGRPTETIGQLQIEMLTKQPGETVLLDVLRNNEVLRMPVKARTLPH